MAKQTHAILIEGGCHEKRIAAAKGLIYEHFADDPESKRRLDNEGLFSRLDTVERGKLDFGDTFEDIVALKRMSDEKDPKKEKKGIVVDQIEELIYVFKQKPFASTGRACIVPRGEHLVTSKNEVQNKLLKLLEEPVPGNIIIIMIQNAESLLATVRSRCARIRLGYEMPAQGPLTDDLRALGRALIYGKGSFPEVALILSRHEKTGEEAVEFLTAFQIFLRTLLIGRLAPELIAGEEGASDSLMVSAAKLQREESDRMRKCVAHVEAALLAIERGDNRKYSMRRMALSTRADIG